ncbi:MAG: ATP--corrinoid adenosyltransferase [Sphaerobacteraceae bacterium]|nr:MAG: ATP--corrinoid adenosyltransferase [Sphaerobacteraceae bacterium]
MSATEETAEKAAETTERSGYLLLLTGDERRTAEAALGIALRGAGHNLRVHISQLLNRADRQRGEVAAVSFLTGVTLSQHGKIGAVQTKADVEGPGITEERLETALQEAAVHIHREVTNILIMDGLLTLIDEGFIDESRVLKLVNRAGAGLDIVLTGRKASDTLIEAADTVTEMNVIKSPGSGDDAPRRGIHY